MIPQWKLNLLATFPRPIAVLMIMLREYMEPRVYDFIGGCILLAWLGSIIIGSVFFGTGGAVITVGGGIGLFSLAWLYDEYRQASAALPKREKKDDDDTDAA